MRTSLAIVAILIIFVGSYVVADTFEKDPCRQVKCFEPVFGRFDIEAELVGWEGEYALCHCPHEPESRIYKIRKP